MTFLAFRMYADDAQFADGGMSTMTADLVPIPKDGVTQVNLLELQEKVAARQQIVETGPVSSRKGRVREAERTFVDDPVNTLKQILDRAQDLFDTFDQRITVDSVPLSQIQINRLSDEFVELERLKVQIEALEKSRYKPIIFAHLDAVVAPTPGRPAAYVPGKVEAEGPGPHYVFERRGGNREAPDLNTETLREALETTSPHLVDEIFKTVHHPAVEAWEEQVFDEGRFNDLVEKKVIDLDEVGRHLTPGKRRSPSFYKTLVDGD